MLLKLISSRILIEILKKKKSTCNSTTLKINRYIVNVFNFYNNVKRLQYTEVLKASYPVLKVSSQARTNNIGAINE